MPSPPIGYELTRQWFEYASTHPDEVSPNHTALYQWLVELNRANGWAAQFACPTAKAVQGMGVKRYETFKKTFDELVAFGFVVVVSAGGNQYTEKKIALLKNSKAIRANLWEQLELPLRISNRRKSAGLKSAQATCSQTSLFGETCKPVGCD